MGLKGFFDTIKSHPIWTGWICAGLLYATGTAIQEGIAEGCFTLGGFVVVSVIVYAINMD